MDNLTHTLVAATLASTPLGRAGRGTTAALIIASNLPDIDIVTTAGGAISYLQWHRGPTHGPIGIIGLGLATAAIVSLAYRVMAPLTASANATAVRRSSERRRKRDPTVENADVASFGMLAIVSTIGVLLHVLMDLPTSYGVRVLSPFSWRWFAADWMPIIDVPLIIVLAAGLLFGGRSPAARRWNAVIVLMLMAANYGLRAAEHHQALVLAPRLLGPTLPQPCDLAATQSAVIDSWPRPPIAMPTLPAGKRCLVEIAAMPTFVSPFSWRVLVQMSNGYEMFEIDLLDARFSTPPSEHDVFWRRVRRYANVWTPAVERAATTHLGRVYLGFSRFPAVRTSVDQEGVTTVRWEDMRFADRPMSPNPNNPRPNLFTAVVRIGGDGQILEERLGR
ncbi:MAG: hypothetical protein AUI64_00890 [Acidobacteria bacterium 13_1_40CM_2_64_6]|nr:MAG: hypothetical protein AUI64_00890 [Acidobacteria bacterium 13_1_40CM_2_64_6]